MKRRGEHELVMMKERSRLVGMEEKREIRRQVGRLFYLDINSTKTLLLAFYANMISQGSRVLVKTR